jgi:putative methanogenesis marker protein 1
VEVWVPANAVFHPYMSKLDMPIFRYNTNGIASGNSLEEAVLHGMFEVIERDAWSICEFQRRPTADLVQDLNGRVSSKLIGLFKEAGVEIHLKDLTSEVGVPTFGAAADDVRLKDPLLLTVGVGTHLNPEIAAIRALTEVAQSRATQLHGIKMDPKWAEANRKLGYERMKAMNRLWFNDHGGPRSISSFEGEDTTDIYDDIQVVLEKLRKAGFERVIVVDLTRDELKVPVVRVIIPGMEVYAMDPEREGPRLSRRRAV